MKKMYQILASALSFVAFLGIGITCTSYFYEPEIPAELSASRDK